MIIIPKPQEMNFFDEKIAVHGLKVKVDDSKILSLTLPLQKETETETETVIYFLKDDDLAEEQYKIVAKDEQIKVFYNSECSVFRAVSTLKQIISQAKDGTIPGFAVNDFPSIPNRGYMLDISRAKIPNLEYLKELVDILSDLKYNQLQLYMDDLVYEFTHFMEYCKDHQPLTKSDILQLDEYCKEHFIQLIPNQNSFGHMEKWLSIKELAHLGLTLPNEEKPSTLNPLCEKSIEFMDQLYDGFLNDFSSEYVHIGMDEVRELRAGKETQQACEQYGVGRVYTDYLNKICSLVREKYNKVPMFWDDIVFKHEEELVNIPKDVVVMEWGYEAEHHYDRNCRRLQELGLKFYVCPGSSMWGTYTGRTNIALVNITSAAECGAYYGADGFLLTEWGDGGNPQFPGTTYFPLVLGGASSWNSGSHDSEVAHWERRELIDACKIYMDKFLYHTRSDTSLADIVFRMGNYYFLEDALRFNGNELSYYKRNIDKLDERKKNGFRRVRKYMQDIYSELEQVIADDIVFREIKTNCRMVILITELLCGIRHDVPEDFIEEYNYLWDINNHPKGKDIFITRLKQLAQLAAENIPDKA